MLDGFYKYALVNRIERTTKSKSKLELTVTQKVKFYLVEFSLN